MVPNLRELRTSRGMSQKELAELIGVTQQAVQQYERDKIEPDINGLKRIADVFDVSVDYLIGHTASESGGHVVSDEDYAIIESLKRLGDYDRQSVERIIRSFSNCS